MNLQEILRAKGLDDKAIEETIGEMKQNKIFTASEENLDIRYKKLKDQHSEASNLIEQLKNNHAGNEELQSKIGEYETKVAQLEAELQQTRINAALKVALLKANVTDVDYLTFKIKEKGEVKLSDDGKIKGIDDTISSLKTQFPQHFTSESKKKIDENKLPSGEEHNSGLTKKEILSKPYTERAQLFQSDPEAFDKAVKADI